MIQPVTITRLKEIFSNDSDGYEGVLDHWAEVAAAVLTLIESDRIGWEMYDRAQAHGANHGRYCACGKST